MKRRLKTFNSNGFHYNPTEPEAIYQNHYNVIYFILFYFGLYCYIDGVLSCPILQLNPTHYQTLRDHYSTQKNQYNSH